MKRRALFSLPLVTAAAFTAGLTGCETPGNDASDTRSALTSFQRPLAYPTPAARPGGGTSGKWTPLPRDGGSEYVQIVGDMEDVVSFYGFSHPVAAEIKSFDDMERTMRGDSSFGFQSLQRGEILGVPVLWFEKVAVDTSGAVEKLVTVLGNKPRRSGVTYQVRTRGAFLLQPGKDPRFVTVACSRTSVHGEIGAMYESQFRTWLTNIVERCFL